MDILKFKSIVDPFLTGDVSKISNLILIAYEYGYYHLCAYELKDEIEDLENFEFDIKTAEKERIIIENKYGKTEVSRKMAYDKE